MIKRLIWRLPEVLHTWGWKLFRIVLVCRLWDDKAVDFVWRRRTQDGELKL